MTKFLRALNSLNGRTVSKVLDIEEIDDLGEVYLSGFVIICTDGHRVTVRLDYDDVEMIATEE